MDVVTFRVDRYDDEGTYIGHTEQVFECEGFLSEMLSNFKTFLQAMTYSYVTSVYAVKSDGVEVGEDD
jgi:hypothetical protein